MSQDSRSGNSQDGADHSTQEGLALSSDRGGVYERGCVMCVKIYIAGPMFGGDVEETGKLARVAMGYSKKLMELGFWVFCPMTNCLLGQFAHHVMLEKIIVGNLEIMGACDYVFMLPNWRDSLEAETERAFAMMHKIPVFYTLKQVERHIERGQQ